MKAAGGIAPFGYRWQSGKLVVDKNEAPVRQLIYELFLKHRRKKTVAKLLNDLGYRTRSSSLFSDTTIDRLLRDTTAKGVRDVDGKIVEVEPIINTEIWDRINTILGAGKSVKNSAHTFSGIAFCGCGGKMVVSGDVPKYVCLDCRRKILADDLEAVFHSQLKEFGEFEDQNLYENWPYLSRKEKRVVTEQLCHRIVIEPETIHMVFAYQIHPYETPVVGQQKDNGNETAAARVDDAKPSSISEPLLSEAEAAKFLGISKMTVLRKRSAGEIGHFKVGFRILYSRERHLIPFLEKCETDRRN